MAWPSIADFSNAIQTPRRCFTDPELSGGELAVHDRGGRAVSRTLIPYTISARRTRRYTSTLYIHCTIHRVGYDPTEATGGPVCNRRFWQLLSASTEQFISAVYSKRRRGNHHTISTALRHVRRPEPQRFGFVHGTRLVERQLTTAEYRSTRTIN